MTKLEKLASEILGAYDCICDRDGNEMRLGDPGFEDHAWHDDNSHGTVGCFHCMAVSALEPAR